MALLAPTVTALQTFVEICCAYAGPHDIVYNTTKTVPLWLGSIRIQKTFALVRVVRGYSSWDINCHIPPVYCMLGLLACSEAYEFGQLGTGLSWFR